MFFGMSKEEKNMKKNHSGGVNFGFWIAIGVGIGTALGVAMGNVAMGVALGAGLALLVWVTLSSQRKNNM